MSMEGTVDEKLNCIIDGMELVNIRMDTMEAEAKYRKSILSTHVDRLNERIVFENDLSKQAIMLNSTIQKVHDNQEVLLAERQDSIDFWRRMKEKIATTSILGAFGLLGTTVWYAIQQFLSHGPKG